MEITTQLGGPFITSPHWLTVPTPVEGFGRALYSFGQPVRIYADQNSQIEISVPITGSVSGQGDSCYITFSGQAVDVS